MPACAAIRYGEAEQKDLVGVTTGLAWTEVGGEILSIEAVTLPGKGKVIITGKLGDVMRESVQAAESYVKSRAADFGIKPTLFERKDIHVHVPEGATPKDGPSAGVAMVTSIVSVLTGIPVRRDVAMTGEITLRGRVLPIGGLKEKLLAALRGGVKTVLIPKDNEKDLAEIPDNVKKGLKLIPVTTADDVLREALSRPLTPIEWVEPARRAGTGAHAADRRRRNPLSNCSDGARKTGAIVMGITPVCPSWRRLTAPKAAIYTLPASADNSGLVGVSHLHSRRGVST